MADDKNLHRLSDHNKHEFKYNYRKEWDDVGGTSIEFSNIKCTSGSHYKVINYFASDLTKALKTFRKGMLININDSDVHFKTGNPFKDAYFEFTDDNFIDTCLKSEYFIEVTN